jgi:hypothetical protein
VHQPKVQDVEPGCRDIDDSRTARTEGRIVNGTPVTVDQQAISSGYVVFARPGDRDYSGVGRFVGVVDDVLSVDGRHYLRVRGGLEDVRELLLPLAEVRTVGSHQVHLQLAVEDLSDQTWHRPLQEAVLRPGDFWG